MKPRKSAHKNRQKDLFRVELMQIIDPGHSLAKLAKVVDWERLEEVFGSTYCSDNGRPADPHMINGGPALFKIHTQPF